MTRRYSLRWRLIASLLLALLLGIGATVGFYVFETGALNKSLRERSLQSQAREILDLFESSDSPDLLRDLAPAWRAAYADPDSGFFYAVYNTEGRLLQSSPNLSPPLSATPLPDGEAFGPLTFIGVGPERLSAMAAWAEGGRRLVVARRDIATEALFWTLMEEDVEFIGVVLLPVAGVAMLLIWLVSGWSLKPLVRASREAAAIGPRNLAARISTAGLPSEIEPLVEAVNGALDRLAEAYAAERRLTADAAHELRTPLTVLSLRLQRARREGSADWEALEREIAQVSRLVAQLLDLARKESAERSGAEIGQTPVNLSRVVREAAASLLPLAEERGRSIDVAAPDAILVRGSAANLTDMVRNLIENALVHGEGTVEATVGEDSANGEAWAWIEVADQGKGVPRGLREAVFERFRKGIVSSPGAGLGLAIVRQVARSHGGDAQVTEGGRVRVTLPRLHA